ncbi:hypothetical protein ANO11243_039970 [Dothideomycetidae sp. 11243]|nr:hypothetical protein ANO11243_039970 [fungal sp. No.11243]
MPWTDLFWQQRTPSQPDNEDDSALTQAVDQLDSAVASQLGTTSPVVTTVLSSLTLTGITLYGIRFYKHNLRRIPTANLIPPRIFRRRTLYGYVTSVGDGDNFRFFHTPGGRFAGWGVLPFRRTHLPVISSPSPASKSSSDTPKPASPKLETIHVRIAGVDAPELAHFGRPAQPFGAEALTFLRELVLHRYVRVQLYRRDQYERVVGTAWVSPQPWRAVQGLSSNSLPVRLLLSPVEIILRLLSGSWNVLRGRTKVDVGQAMLDAGFATVYEAKFGSEFGGQKKEDEYRAAEKLAKDKKRGMWGSAKSELEKAETKEQGLLSRIASTVTGSSSKSKTLETPREYKNRMREMEEGKAGAADKTKK